MWHWQDFELSLFKFGKQFWKTIDLAAARIITCTNKRDHMTSKLASYWQAHSLKNGTSLHEGCTQYLQTYSIPEIRKFIYMNKTMMSNLQIEEQAIGFCGCYTLELPTWWPPGFFSRVKTFSQIILIHCSFQL